MTSAAWVQPSRTRCSFSVRFCAGVRPLPTLTWKPMHQQPPHTPLFASTSRANAGHVCTSRGRTERAPVVSPVALGSFTDTLSVWPRAARCLPALRDPSTAAEPVGKAGRCHCSVRAAAVAGATSKPGELRRPPDTAPTKSSRTPSLDTGLVLPRSAVRALVPMAGLGLAVDVHLLPLFWSEA